MNKKIYQTAGKKKEKKVINKDAQHGEIIPEDQVWEDGKIVKIVKTGTKTQRVVIGVYYTDAKGNKIKGLKPVEGTIPRRRKPKKSGGVMQYKYGGPKMYQQAGINEDTRPIATRNVNTDFFDPNVSANASVAGNIGGNININPRLGIGPDRNTSFYNQNRLTLGPSLTHSNIMKNTNQDFIGQSRNTLGAKLGFQAPIGNQGLIGGLSGEAGTLLKGANRSGDISNNLVNDYNRYGQVGAGLGYYPKHKNWGIKGNINYGSEKSNMPGLNYGATANWGPASFNINKGRHGVGGGFGLSLPIGGPTRRERQTGGTRYDERDRNIKNKLTSGLNKLQDGFYNSFNSITDQVTPMMDDASRRIDGSLIGSTLGIGQGIGGMMLASPAIIPGAGVVGTEAAKYLVNNLRPPTAEDKERAADRTKRFQNPHNMPHLRQTGGMYGSNTLSAAGQGSPQLGMSSTIVGQETDPALQEARMQGLAQSGQGLSGESEVLAQQTRQQEVIDKQRAEQAAMQAEQQYQQQNAAIGSAVSEGAQLLGNQVSQGNAPGPGSWGEAWNLGKQGYNLAKAANMANDVSKMGEAAQLVTDAGGWIGSSADAAQTGTMVLDAAGNTVNTGSAVAGGLNSAMSAMPWGTIANYAGKGITALSDDDDPTKSNVGEYTGNIVSRAGQGASLGSFFPGPGTAIGAGIGAVVGGVEQLVGTNKARKAEREYETEARTARNKGIYDLNDRVSNLYGSNMSNVAAGNLAQKTVSGQNLGRNVMYKNGGMMMRMPRYGYNS